MCGKKGVNIEIIENGPERLRSIDDDLVEPAAQEPNEDKYNSPTFVIIISFIVGVTVLILTVIVVFSIISRRMRSDEKKEVIDDNFYYGYDGDVR